MKTGKPVVAVVCADKPLCDGSGAFHALRCEVEGLRAAGADPVLVVTAPSLRPWHGMPHALQALIHERANALRLPLAAIVPPDTRPGAWFAYVKTGLHAALKRPFGPAQDIALGRLSTPVPTADLGCAPSAVLANNLTSLAVADHLVPCERQLVVLHYLPTRQPTSRFLAAIAGRSSLMALGQDDAATLRQLLPQATVHAGLHIRPESLHQNVSSPVFANLAEALSASGAALEPSEGWAVTGWGQRQATDLLFVGDAHPDNVAALSAFVRTTFTPHLASHNISLVIAGAVGPALGDVVRHPAIAVTGYCRDLVPLYAASRLVVAPMLTGDGVATKTIEAVAMGKPILATSVGLRGLGDLADFALPSDFHTIWPERIMALLADQKAQARWVDGMARRILGPTLAASLIHLLPALLHGRTIPPLPAAPLLDTVFREEQP